jgi:hypothetical protein
VCVEFFVVSKDVKSTCCFANFLLSLCRWQEIQDDGSIRPEGRKWCHNKGGDTLTSTVTAGGRVLCIERGSSGYDNDCVLSEKYNLIIERDDQYTQEISPDRNRARKRKVYVQVCHGNCIAIKLKPERVPSKTPVALQATRRDATRRSTSQNVRL